MQNNLIFSNNYGIKTEGISKIEGNTIINNNIGINGGDPIINNIIANNSYGIIGGSTVEGNLVINNHLGLKGGTQIRNNTIANNSFGIESSFSTLLYNNIQNNGLNVNFTSSNDGNATYNWWGTTDAAAINQTIYDYKKDFSLGRVNFVPILTASNDDAPSVNTPIPTLPSPNPPPTIPELPTPILLVIIIILTSATLALAIKSLKKKL